MSQTNYNKDTHSTFISLSTHRLFLSISGPDRTPDQPIVLIFPGVGTSIKEWAAVKRLLEQTVRTLLYERAGYGESDESPNPPTAINIAMELDELLTVADIQPPYVIVCHSYGGITAREFIHLRQQRGGSDDIIGMVLVDANQEQSIANWPSPVLDPLAQGLDFNAALGLPETRRLTDDEWAAMLKENQSERHQKTSGKEMEHYIDSCKELGTKKQLNRNPPLLGNHPVVVLMGNAASDHWKVYNAGIAIGNGTEQERADYRQKMEEYPVLDEKFQRETLSLSTRSVFRWAVNSGHWVHVTEPERIVDEVISVLTA
ncbi:hypothetical protein MW887_001057 [Aspergillus wentii]|nr:hypothetical protein MW887_001057 [Aspergillus wentii]